MGLWQMAAWERYEEQQRSRVEKAFTDTGNNNEIGYMSRRAIRGSDGEASKGLGSDSALRCCCSHRK